MGPVAETTAVIHAGSLWRAVGEALLEGKKKENRPGRKFSQWCEDWGFDMDRRVRADAMWLAENWNEMSTGWTNESHPSHIRQAFSQQKVAAPAPELILEAPERLSASIEQVAPQAKTINKLKRMADSGDHQEALHRTQTDSGEFN